MSQNRVCVLIAELVAGANITSHDGAAATLKLNLMVESLWLP